MFQRMRRGGRGCYGVMFRPMGSRRGRVAGVCVPTNAQQGGGGGGGGLL